MKKMKICRNCSNFFVQTKYYQNFCCKECEEKYKLKKEKKSFLILRFEIFKRDNFTCQYCGRNVQEDKIKLEIDHINPKSKGGEDEIDNYITSCYECNRGKGDILLRKHMEIEICLKGGIK